MQGRSKRGVCCPGPQPEDLSPRGRQHEPCGRDRDGEGGWLCEWERHMGTRQDTEIDMDSVDLYVCKTDKCIL